MDSPPPDSEAVDLSVVVPVYNAEGFIADSLATLLGWLAAQSLRCELIVVDDGSTDGTAERVQGALDGASLPCRLLRQPDNRGKGAALRRGMQAARGGYRVFIDADLAYPPKEIATVLQALRDGAEVAIASRVHPESRYVIRPSFFRYLYTRHLAGRIFNALVRLFLLPGIRDTQAGLKGFRAAAADRLFSGWLPQGFSVDLAVLARARRHGLRIEQIPVLYRYDTEPTTVRFLMDTVLVLADMARIRLRREAPVSWPEADARDPSPPLPPAHLPWWSSAALLAAGTATLTAARLVWDLPALAVTGWLLSLIGLVWAARRADPHPGVRRIGFLRRPADLAALAALVAVAATLRIGRLDEIPPMIHGDTAECGLIGLRLLAGKVTDVFDLSPWYYVPYLSFLPYTASFAALGHSILALRLPSALIGTAVVVPLYALVRSGFGPRVALVSGLLYATSHAAIHFSRIGLWNIQVLLYEVTAFAFLVAGLRRRSPSWVALAGTVTGLALYSYTAGRIIPLVAALVLLAEVPRQGLRSGLRFGAWYAGAAVLTVLPLLLNYMQDPDILFADRTASVWVLSEINRPHVEGTLGAASTSGILLEQVRRTFAGFWSMGDSSAQYGTTQPLLSPLTALLAAAGLLLSLRRICERRFLLMALWSLCGLLFGSILIIDPPAHTRLIVLFPVPFILAALVLDRILQTAVRVPRGVVALALIVFIAQSAYFNLAGYRSFVAEMRVMSREWDVLKVFERLRGDYDYYLFTGPFLLADSPIFRFASSERAVAGFTDLDVPERLAADTAFVLTPEFRRVGHAIADRYPGAEREVRSEEETTQLVVYRCTADNGCRGAMPPRQPINGDREWMETQTDPVLPEGRP